MISCTLRKRNSCNCFIDLSPAHSPTSNGLCLIVISSGHSPPDIRHLTSGRIKNINNNLNCILWARPIRRRCGKWDFCGTPSIIRCSCGPLVVGRSCVCVIRILGTTACDVLNLWLTYRTQCAATYYQLPPVSGAV